MILIEVKASELVGNALDWAVFCAVYPGMQPTINVIPASSIERKPFIRPLNFPRAVSLSYSGAYGVEIRWAPSTDWEQGGPLIDKYQIDLNFERKGLVYAHLCADDGLPITCREDGSVRGGFGSTHLIAACRAIVAARLGDVVSVPAELAEP